MDNNTHIAMASADRPDEIIKATQQALISAIRSVIKDTQANTKNNGLTWAQIYFVLDGFETKEIQIIEHQGEIM